MSTIEGECEEQMRTSRFDFDATAPSFHPPTQLSSTTYPFYTQTMLEREYRDRGIICVDCRYCSTGRIITDGTVSDHIGSLLALACIRERPPTQSQKQLIDGVATSFTINDYSQFLRDWLLENVIDEQTRVKTQEWLASIGKDGEMMGEFYGFDPSFEFVSHHPYRELVYKYKGKKKYGWYEIRIPPRRVVFFTWPQPQVLLCLYALYSKTSVSRTFSFGIHAEPHPHGN